MKLNMRMAINLLTVLSLLQLGSSQNIVEVAENNGSFGTFAEAVTGVGLRNVLSGTDKLTVFAPTDDAFDNVDDATMNRISNGDWKKHLEDLLEYHVINGEYTAANLEDNMHFTTLNSEDIIYNIDFRGDVRIEDQEQRFSNVIEPDIPASNGVIHAIDRVLLPASITFDIADLLETTQAFSTFFTLLGLADLTTTLGSPGDYTVFAPTDEAFDVLPQEDVAWLTDPVNRDALSNVLKYHVISVHGYSNDFENGRLETLLGQDVTASLVGDGMTVNDSNVIMADFLANNGVIHVIDTVLIPKGIIPGKVPSRAPTPDITNTVLIPKDIIPGKVPSRAPTPDITTVNPTVVPSPFMSSTIIYVLVGSVSAVIICLAVFFILKRRRTASQKLHSQTGHQGTDHNTVDTCGDKLNAKTGNHVLISARFDGGEKERIARGLYEELRKIKVNAYIVETKGVGDTFGAQTISGLDGMQAMVAVCFDNYGEKTESVYCSYHELKYASQRKIPVLPIKLCKNWPPAKCGEEGRKQNIFVFMSDLLYQDWWGKTWDPKTCARQIKTSLDGMQSSA